jgi:hypothetical protein
MLLNLFIRVAGMIRLLTKLSCILCLLFSSTVVAADNSVNGMVRDSEGAAIENAHIVIRADSSGRREPVRNHTLTIETDKQGHFSAPLNSGFYDVCVMADAFSPQCQKVFAGSQSVALKINLKADPEVMKRLGDTF